MSLLHRLEGAPSGAPPGRSWLSPHFVDCQLTSNVPSPSKAVCFPQRRCKLCFATPGAGLPRSAPSRQGTVWDVHGEEQGVKRTRWIVFLPQLRKTRF